MILEYSYDKAKQVLELLKKGKIATLNVTKVDEGKFAMEYTLITDYSELRQQGIHNLSMKSLPERLNIINIFNIFFENMVLNNIETFSIKFDVSVGPKCIMLYSYELKHKIENVVVADQLIECLDKLELLATKMGILDVETDLYKREGSGKGKKYSVQKIAHVLGTIRKAIGE